MQLVLKEEHQNMEAETFPDVTLANNSATEQNALNTLIPNEGSSGKETFVILKSKRKRYQISLTKTIFIIFIAAFIFALAILITALVTKLLCSESPTKSLDRVNSSTASSENWSTVSTTSTSTIPTLDNSTIYPWSGIRLPRSVKPSLYELHLQIDLTKFVFHGSVNITIHIIKPTKYIIVHRNEIDIELSSVSLNSVFSSTPHIVTQHHFKKNNFHVLEMNNILEQGYTYILSIGRFSGTLDNNLKGLYLSSYKNLDNEIRYLAVTQFQAMDARRVFPCFDEPSFKARFKISITHQNGYTALTNMPATTTTVLNTDWIRKDYQTTPVMSTYLLAIVVSDFKSRNYTFSSGYELKIWARPDAYSQTEHALDVARKFYDFFTDYFGTADVVPKADHVAVPDFGAGAMENWGLVVYRETALLYDPQVSSSINKYTVTFVVAHEIAHTWFGNMVTMEWWDDLWLNEGFANLLMYIAMDHVFPQWNVFAIVIVDDILPVMLEDALTTSHPVSSQINNPEEINQRFDSISYNKGMAVLRMMMDFAGKENFKNGLRMYIDRYKFKNADMNQLWTVFTEAFNHSYNVAEIMDTWTRQVGYPVVIVEDSGDQLVLRQEVFLLDYTMHTEQKQQENPFGYKWYIPFTYVTQDSPRDKTTAWLNLDTASIRKPVNGWLLGNYEMVGYYRVKYNQQMWRLLTEQLIKDHTVIPEVNRAGLIGDAFALARANLLDYDVAFSLTRYLKKEQSYVPWQAFLHAIDFIKGMLVNRVAYAQLQNYIQELVVPVFDIVGASDKGELPERYLRRVILYLACDIGMEKAVTYAESTFSNWMTQNKSLPPDLALLIYSVGVREGGAVEWSYVWNKSLTTEVTAESEMLMESLTQTQKPWLLWRYINWIFDADKIRLQNVRFVIECFTKTPLARMIALEFLMSRWDEIVKRFELDSFLVSEIITKTTIFVNSDFHLKQLQALFKDNVPASSTNAVQNSLALIKANIGWMDANYEEITKWLNEHKM